MKSIWALLRCKRQPRRKNDDDFISNTDSDYTKPDPEKLEWWWIIPFVGFIGLIIGLTFVAMFKLPTALDDNANQEEFIGVQARRDLEELVSLGQRPTGSTTNEVTTVKYLTDKINAIMDESNGLYTFETDIQVASGGTPLISGANMYESIQNVLVKMTPKNPSTTNGVLLNSHFDTVIGTTGAGDDSSMVVVMLGIMRALSKSKEAVKNPIIFLFNGDEENGLQAAHAFVMQHPWAKDVSAFINLDGMGVGGREILFQTGPGNIWLIDYYADSAKHPFASVMGEEVFDGDLVPSDTDFTVFNRYGNLIGLNFAYIYGGYAYHLEIDSIRFVESGVLQHTGDNILALTKALGNAAQVTNGNKFSKSEKAVYFDVFGIFMINYSEEAGIAINCLIGVLALLLIGVSIFLIHKTTKISIFSISLQFAISFGFQLIAVAVSIGVILFLAFFIDAVDYSMAWYSQQWVIFGVYFCPMIFFLGLTPMLFFKWKTFNVLPLKFGILMFLHANCVILVLLIFTLTGLSIRSTFLITNVVMFYALSLIIHLAFGLYKKDRIWILAILFGQAVPLAFTSYIMEIIYTVFIPITGRQTGNPEYMIAFCAIGICLLMFGFIIPIISIFRKAKYLLLAIFVVFAIFFILTFTAVCFPYTAGGKPQRQSATYAKRVNYNSSGSVTFEDAVYHLHTYDTHSARTLKDIAKENGLKLYSRKEDTSDLQFYQSAYWIGAPVPQITNPAILKLISKDEILPNTCRYTLQITGGLAHYKFFIAPINNAELVNWSFSSGFGVPLHSIPNSEYYVYLKIGKDIRPYTFSLTLRVTNSSVSSLSIGMQADYLESTGQHNEFEKFLNLFPDWTCTRSVVQTFDRYLF